jgi:ATP-dependent helicase Lhr and Lhr-like helicase
MAALNEELLSRYREWFAQNNWKAFPFQEEVLNAYLEGKSGLLNAPTGSGKTFAMWLPVLMEEIGRKKPSPKGYKALWITPLKALAKDITAALQMAASQLSVPWEIALRTGDTSLSERSQQKRKVPDCLITTPESLHVLLSNKGYESLFSGLRVIIADEWHELMGTKRGVQLELAISRLKSISPGLKIWGISATIGNLEEALHVLLGESVRSKPSIMVQARMDKDIIVESVLPDEVESFPWAGHLGTKLLPKIIPVIESGSTTLLFTNTRSQAEIWYQRLLEFHPDLAGVIGLHHGSLAPEMRSWIENALHQHRLKLVVATSSLDLGVDFRPVDTVIQIGSPKGVARFLQRAGRSGHSPGARSRIYFVPTHSLELIEAAALRTAINNTLIEKRIPLVRAFDVLIQYLVTLAVSDGFYPDKIFGEVQQTFAFSSVTREEWQQMLQFITSGGTSLKNYEEFSKVEIHDGLYKVTSKGIAQRHRLSIGTIVGDNTLAIKFMNGTYIGSIEEFFIARLNKGDVFSFAGRNLEYLMIKDNSVIVRKSERKKAIVPQWMGGKMNLSSQLSAMIRRKLTEALEGTSEDIEIRTIQPLLERQKRVSRVPSETQFLIEKLESKDGYHIFFYTFEGRYVNEGMAALLAYRFSKIQPVTFSIAMTDYGFELLSDQEPDLDTALELDLFSTDNLLADIQGGINTTEMARRKFRNIARIAGLIFTGYPGREMRNRHIQASSRLFFEVFSEYEPENLLLRQAYEEVLSDQLDETRLRSALTRIQRQEVLIIELQDPSPFCFPIMAERFREKHTSEKLEERLLKIIRSVDNKEPSSGKSAKRKS